MSTVAPPDYHSIFLTPDQVVARVEVVLQLLKERGLRPTGRCDQLVSVLRDHRDRKPVDKRLLPPAFLDLSQLSAIAEHLGGCTQPAFDKKLRLVVRDPAYPPDSKPETPGRDVQFELYLAAHLKARGVDAVHFDEPDLVAEIGGLSFGFAAKRPKSRRKLRTRLGDAIEQLQRRGRAHGFTHGIAALDLSALANPKAAAAVARVEGAEGSPARQLVVAPVAKHLIDNDILGQLLVDRDVRLTCGVLLFGAATQLRRDGGIVNSASFMLLRVGSEYEAALDTLWDKLRC